MRARELPRSWSVIAIAALLGACMAKPEPTKATPTKATPSPMPHPTRKVVLQPDVLAELEVCPGGVDVDLLASFVAHVRHETVVAVGPSSSVRVKSGAADEVLAAAAAQDGRKIVVVDGVTFLVPNGVANNQLEQLRVDGLTRSATAREPATDLHLAALMRDGDTTWALLSDGTKVRGSAVLGQLTGSDRVELEIAGAHEIAVTLLGERRAYDRCEPIQLDLPVHGNLPKKTKRDLWTPFHVAFEGSLEPNELHIEALEPLTGPVEQAGGVLGQLRVLGDGQPTIVPLPFLVHSLSHVFVADIDGDTELELVIIGDWIRGAGQAAMVSFHQAFVFDPGTGSKPGFKLDERFVAASSWWELSLALEPKPGASPVAVRVPR